MWLFRESFTHPSLIAHVYTWSLIYLALGFRKFVHYLCPIDDTVLPKYYRRSKVGGSVDVLSVTCSILFVVFYLIIITYIF